MRRTFADVRDRLSTQGGADGAVCWWATGSSLARSTTRMDTLGAFIRLWCLHHVRELLQPGVSLLQVGCTSLAEQTQLALVVAAAMFAGSEPRLFLAALAARSAFKLAELPFVWNHTVRPLHLQAESRRAAGSHEGSGAMHALVVLVRPDGRRCLSGALHPHYAQD